MKSIPLILAIFITVICQIASLGQKVFLDGNWRFELDRTDIGLAEKWYSRFFTNTLTLPGSLPAQGIGDDIRVNTPWTATVAPSWYVDPKYTTYRQPGNIKVSFLLQPDKYFVGAAWYQREIEIPLEWNGMDSLLSLERAHWGTMVWVDGVFCGQLDSLGIPHNYNLGRISPGSHLLSIRVDNRPIVNVGVNASSVTDHTQGNWNGIVGEIFLRAQPVIRFDDVKIFPHIATKSITIKGSLANPQHLSETGSVAVTVSSKTHLDWPVISTTSSVSLTDSNNTFNIEMPLGSNAPYWDEFKPELFELSLSVSNTIKLFDTNRLTFGLREVATEGTQFILNGRKTFLRGTLECCVFPNSGHPPTDLASWRRIVSIAKSFGLNLIRFHTWCPPEAAFQAADELGFYFQIECETWTNPGDGTSVDDWLYVETERILKNYGNHPSFLLMASGNEPAGSNYRAYLSSWVTYFKSRDNRCLFTGASGWPELPENQFQVAGDLSGEPRIQSRGAGLYSSINSEPPGTTNDFAWYINPRRFPVISHEIGQWCVYPDLGEIPYYTNYLKPKNLEIFRDFLNQHGMSDLAKPFLMASGKLQALCYKEEIESALRTVGMAGFELLGLTDFPGQGPAPVGVLNAFWNEKGYISAEEFRHFCNSSVPLLRMGKRVFTNDEWLDATAEIAHFGPVSLTNSIPAWSLVDEQGATVRSGVLPARNIPIGNGISLGKLHISLGGVPSPMRYQLALSISGTDLKITNNWDIWVYPSKLPDPPGEKPIITDLLTPTILGELTNGAAVFLSIPFSKPGNPTTARIPLGFSSIFWNTAWFGGKAPTTLGILCDPSHPLFKYFPTESHSNWQWWYLLAGADAMDLEAFSVNLKPLVRVIDDWFSARRLGILFEAKVGLGKLIVSSVNLDKGLNTNIVARQFRFSLLNYLASPDFAPRLQIGVDQLVSSSLGIVAEAPSITDSPREAFRSPGHRFSFDATLSGTLPIEFTWFHGRIPILNGIAESNRTVSLTISNASQDDEGYYVLRAINPFGTIESRPVPLTIYTPAPGSYLDAIINRNPISYWQFDQSSADFSGAPDLAGDNYMKHLNASPGVGPRPPDFNGFAISNAAVLYNGIDGGSEAARLSIGNWTEFTISGWFNPKSMPQPARTALFGQNDFVELGFHDLPGGSTGGLGVWVAGQVSGQTGYGTLLVLTNTDSVVTAGKWHFLAVTVDSANISLYLNGVRTITAPGKAQNIYNSTSPFRAGFGTLDEIGNNFEGLIDEVAVFDRALSSDEINALFAKAIGPTGNLTVRQIDGIIVLFWKVGILEYSADIRGPFQKLPDASSPYTNSVIDQTKFFRLQLSR